MLTRALNSVMKQTLQPDAYYITVDTDRRGSAHTRNRGLMQVNTQWTAFLDSDDEFMPHHLETLVDWVDDEVDVIYTGCEVRGPSGEVIPRHEEWGRFGHPFDGELLQRMSYIPVTSLVRTEVACAVGGFDFDGESPYDDWVFYRRILQAGGVFLHVPEVTWIWHHHGMNTSGKSTQGDAL